MPPHSPERRALFLTPERPGLGQGGGALRSESLLQYLQRDYHVDVVTFTLREHSKTPMAKVLRNASRVVRGKPPLFDRYSGYEDQIRAAIPAAHYELGVIEHFWCASYAPLLRPLCDRLVLDLHNIESELARTHAAAVTGSASWASTRFASMYRDLEREWLPKFDTLLVTSEADRARIQHPDIRVFANAIPEVPLPQVPETDTVVFSGNLEYHPNVEAVRWFAQEIWPQVRARIPAAEWCLIGRNPEAIASLITSPGIRVTGPVEDAVAALATGRVCVVPLLSGSGTRFKILEAWAAGRAVVSTTIGAEGLGAIDGEHLLIADTAQSFADAIARLWHDPELRTRLGKAGRQRYEQHFTWRTLEPRP
ncbi:MAG: glycosyltransferase family 4 protein [Bryobacteraceae bacterium]